MFPCEVFKVNYVRCFRKRSNYELSRNIIPCFPFQMGLKEHAELVKSFVMNGSSELINKCIRGSLRAADIKNKMGEHWICWFNLVEDQLRVRSQGQMGQQLAWMDMVACGIDGALPEDRRSQKAAIRRPLPCYQRTKDLLSY